MNQQESSVPRHPSNRSLIEQMLLWGWAMGGRKGGWQEMIGAPIGNTHGKTMAVRPASTHEANPTSIFLEVYKLTTNDDADSFWEGPPDPKFWASTVKQARERDRARKEQEQADALLRAGEAAQRQAILDRAAARRAERTALLEPTKPEPAKARKPRKEAQPPVTTSTVERERSKIRSQDVLEVLSRYDRPMTLKAIAQVMGVDGNNNTIRDALATRCWYLTTKGLATRVMSGTYRAATPSQPVAARFTHDVLSHEQEHMTPPAPRPAPTPAPTIESLDDSIEAVLDLLLPNGFRAADLRYIAPWVEQTKAMVEQVTR